MLRWLIVVFLALIIFSGLQKWLQKFGFGRLPGDFRFRLFGRAPSRAGFDAASPRACNTNVLQCTTPMATYAHLALPEPIAHPGRGMPVLSSTVHIARHAFQAGPRRFFASLFMHLCTVRLFA
jgi:hypothetical protein